VRQELFKIQILFLNKLGEHLSEPLFPRPTPRTIELTTLVSKALRKIPAIFKAREADYSTTRVKFEHFIWPWLKLGLVPLRIPQVEGNLKQSVKDFLPFRSARFT
jgi:hypothetical protein